ncbi:MAG: hypothetical protein ACFFD8_08780 [Candidatus Thorarchaeota archaeon]
MELFNRTLVLYVRSVEASTRRGPQVSGKFTCACIRKDVEALKNKSASTWEKFFSDEDWKAIQIAEDVAKKTGNEIRVIDLSTRKWDNLYFRLKRFGRTPWFVRDKKRLPHITSSEQLIRYVVQ